ncbi:hypothetical protein EDD22DRAFT_863577 [Suillus occidentalis]|nr:hypothetical protein EDD22DRAFT_863577 [Suillus occidentalis]
MSTAIEAPLPRAPTSEFNLLDAQANESQASDHSPLPCQPLHANSRITIIQNNFIAEGMTINIFSSNCHGSTVTRLYGDVAGTASAEPTSSQLPMLARQSEPAEYRDGCENIILNGNTFGPHAMINIGSQHCTGAGLMRKIKFDTVVKHSFDLSLSYVLCGLQYMMSSISICLIFVLK